VNFPHRTTCFACYMPKAAAPALKQASNDADLQSLRDATAQKMSAQAAGDVNPTSSKRAQQRAKKAVKKAQGPQNPATGGLAPDGAVPLASKGDGAQAASDALKPVPGGTPPPVEPAEPDAPPADTAEAAKTAPKEPWKPRPLETKVVDLMNGFLPSWQTINESIMLDLFPTEANLKTPEEVMNNLLAEQIKLGTEGSPADKLLKDLLEKEEAALAKAKKGAPPSDILACALRKAAEDWQMTVKERQNRAKTGSAKAEERQKERLEKIARLEREVGDIRRAIQYHDKAYEETYKERSEAYEKEDEAVAQMIQSRIEEEEKKDRTSNEQEAKKVAANCLQVQNEELIKSMAEHEALRKKTEELSAKISHLQHANASASAAKAGTGGSATPPRKAPRLSSDDVVDSADPDNLPGWTPTAGQQTEVCHNLFCLLQLWNLHGCLPVTFADFRQHSSAGQDFDLAMVNLLGGPLWKEWFGEWVDDKRPGAEELIPRQALIYTNLALEKIKASFAQEPEVKAVAKTSYTAMSEASKRRREE
jgi:hypothetical protein